MIGTILIIILILALVGALPTWGHSKSWGYFPQWRPRPDPDHPDYSGVDGSTLTFTVMSENRETQGSPAPI